MKNVKVIATLMTSTMIAVSTTISLLTGVNSASAQTYANDTTGIDCKCRTVNLSRLTSADLAQDATSQDAAWALFKATYALADGDRLGNRTYTYNCWSYVLRGGDRWLNEWDKYVGDTAKCWEIKAGGTIKLNGSHGMLADASGKCGQSFVCKRNDLVYGADTPTDLYKQIP